MKTWQDLSTEEKIEAVIAAYAKLKINERTLTTIAEKINHTTPGATRNAITGIYNRNKNTFRKYPLDGKYALMDEARPKAVKGRGVLKSAKVNKTPPPPVVKKELPPEPVRIMKLLVDLNIDECKWPESGTGAATIFCGCPTDRLKPYCTHHTARAAGRGTLAERSVTEQQALRPSKLLGRITGKL